MPPACPGRGNNRAVRAAGGTPDEAVFRARGYLRLSAGAMKVTFDCCASRGMSATCTRAIDKVPWRASVCWPAGGSPVRVSMKTLTSASVAALDRLAIAVDSAATCLDVRPLASRGAAAAIRAGTLRYDAHSA